MKVFGKLTHVLAAVVFGAASASAQEFTRTDNRTPSLTSYVIELIDYSVLRVGTDLKERDGVAELRDATVTLEATGRRPFPALMPRLGSRSHSIKARAGEIELLETGTPTFGQRGKLDIRANNLIRLGLPANRPLQNLSVEAEPGERIDITVDTFESDCAASEIYNCTRGDGTTLTYEFIVPRFLTDLPSRCEPRNTFELNRVDFRFQGFGPFEILGIDTNASPARTVTRVNTAKLCIRKKFGSPYSTHQLFSVNQNACVTIADLPDEMLFNVRVQACATTDSDFNDQSFEVVPVQGRPASVRLVWRNSQGSEGQSCLGVNSGFSNDVPPFVQLFRCDTLDARQYFEILREPNRALPGVLIWNRSTNLCLRVFLTTAPAAGPGIETAACAADDSSQRWWVRSSYLEVKYDANDDLAPVFGFTHGVWSRQ